MDRICPLPENRFYSPLNPTRLMALAAYDLGEGLILIAEIRGVIRSAEGTNYEVLSPLRVPSGTTRDQ